VRYEARRALQSIRFRCLATGVADDDHPLRVAVSFRVSPAEVPPTLVGRSRYAVGRFLDFAVFLAAGPWDTVKRPHKPLFEFRSPPEYYPAVPSRSAGADRLLSWASVPFSTRGFGGLLTAGFPGPATFRPQGLTTLSTAYSLRAPAGFVSHQRRSWDLPFGAFPSHKVSERFRTEGPTYRLTRRLTVTRRQLAGPAGRGSWALTLAIVPGDRTRD
jgi:hypothetical protein